MAITIGTPVIPAALANREVTPAPQPAPAIAAPTLSAQAPAAPQPQRRMPNLFSRVTGVHISTNAPGSPLVIYGVILLLMLFAAPAGASGLVRRLVTGTSAVAAWARSRTGATTG